MKLKQLYNNSFYIPNTSNIGVIRSGSSVVLIDSGLDDDTGKKIIRCLESEGLKPKAIINTHSHADHIGGNSFIKEKTGAAVYSPEIEASFVRYPYFEPFYLFSGANPIKDLRNKFLMAKPSFVDNEITGNQKKLIIEDLELNIVRLPGHSLNQIGVEYEGVFYCGDSIFSIDTLSRHKLPFCMDVAEQVKTLELLMNTQYRNYVPSHGEPLESVKQTASIYLEIINNIEEAVMELLDTERPSEYILKGVLDKFNAELKSAQQYYLMNTIVMAYTGYLYDRGKILLSIKENVLYWNRI